MAKVLGYILIASITATLTILAYNTSSDGAWLIVPLIVFYISYRLHKAIISWLRRRILSNHLQTKKKKKERNIVEKRAVAINNIEIENKNFDVEILSKLLDQVTCNKGEVLKQLVTK